jgi:hypothetical protein
MNWEKIRQRHHIAIDTLDHLTGGVGSVKGHIQAQGVTRQIQAQVVGGSPAEVFGYVGHQNAKQLLADRHADEDQRQAVEVIGCPACPRRIDEIAHDQGVGQLQGDADEQRHTQVHNQVDARSEVVP